MWILRGWVEVLLALPGIFEALRDYDPSDEPEVDGYLLLQLGDRVQVHSNTRLAGEMNNMFREYVFGYLLQGADPVRQGWLPTAVLSHALEVPAAGA